MSDANFHLPRLTSGLSVRALLMDASANLECPCRQVSPRHSTGVIGELACEHEKVEYRLLNLFQKTLKTAMLKGFDHVVYRMTIRNAI